jgi:hypothetical protein
MSFAHLPEDQARCAQQLFHSLTRSKLVSVQF